MSNYSSLRKTYEIDAWTDADDFLSKVATRYGKLIKGGEPDRPTVAKMILNDLQRGKIPYFVRPPGSREDEVEEASSTQEGGGDVSAKDEDDKEEEANSDDSMTDVGSTCSGLSDVSRRST